MTGGMTAATTATTVATTAARPDPSAHQVGRLRDRLRGVQQVGDEIRELVGVLLDGCQVLRAAHRVLHRAVALRLGKSLDRGDRRAELVGDVGDEFLAQLLVTDRFRRVVDDQHNPR